MIRNDAVAVQGLVTPHGTLSCRPESAADNDFLFSLFETVKGPDFAHMPVDDGMKAQLLHMQYRAMTQSYRAGFPDAAFAIVTLDDAPVGRLITDVIQDRIHVVYIAFLPRWRRQGIGTALMRAVLANASPLGLGCEAVVSIDNTPSLRLWAALGFTERERNASDIILNWRPSPQNIV